MSVRFLNEKFSNKWCCAELFACSITGTDHSGRGQSNQDAFHYFVNDDVIALAIADGVGSCRYAGEGSAAAVSTVSDLASVVAEISASDDAIYNFIVSTWRSRLAHEKVDSATTFRYVIIRDVETMLFSIGDGETMIMSPNSFVSITDETSFLNSTFALSDNVTKEQLRIHKMPIITDGIAILMTDGISIELEPTAKMDFAKYIQRMMTEEKDYAAEILKWVESLQLRNGDDKTILLLNISSSLQREKDV